MNIKFGSGAACNFAGKSAKGEFTITGDPAKKIEKPHTILNFPGGHVEISRTEDNEYWAHIAVEKDHYERPDGYVVDARIDAQGRYVSKEINKELESTDFVHIAVRIATR